MNRLGRQQWRYAWLVGSLLLVPGFLPFVADYFVRSGLMGLPVYVNPRIFYSLAIIFYVVDVPLFFFLCLRGNRLVWFALFGAVAPLIALLLVSIANPIPTLEDDQLAREVFAYCVWFIVPFGVVDGLLFWLIGRAMRKARYIGAIRRA
jgi:hypothetical protein